MEGILIYLVVTVFEPEGHILLKMGEVVRVAEEEG